MTIKQTIGRLLIAAGHKLVQSDTRRKTETNNPRKLHNRAEELLADTSLAPMQRNAAALELYKALQRAQKDPNILPAGKALIQADMDLLSREVFGINVDKLDA